MRTSITKIKPDTERLFKRKQCQMSLKTDFVKENTVYVTVFNSNVHRQNL
jgi:hypothetical protein